MKYLGISTYIVEGTQTNNINFLKSKGLKSIRYSSRYTTSTSDFHSKRLFSQTVLNNLTSAGIKVIVCPNHIWATNDSGTWDINVINQIYRDNWNLYLENFRDIVVRNQNNPLVAYEFFNESNMSDIVARHQEALNLLREISNQDYVATFWQCGQARKLNDPANNTYYGTHRYANYGGYDGYVNDMNRLLGLGIPANKIVNTEIGAHTNEASSFTQALVDRVNNILTFNKDIGNMVWYYDNLANRATYEQMGLSFPVSSQTDTPTPEPEPPTPTPTQSLKAEAILLLSLLLAALKEK